MHFNDLIKTIKERREALQVTQEGLAELSGVGLRTLKQFESGKGNPTLLTLQKLSNQPFIYMYLIVIAKIFPASVVGIYYFAEKIKDLLINQLVSAIQTVSYPALVSLETNSDMLIAGYRKLISTITFVFFPILIFR